MPNPKVQTEGPGIYVYKPEDDHRRSLPDALGNQPTGNGRTYLTVDGWSETLTVETASGDELVIKMTPDGNGIEIRNQGRSMRTSLVTAPHSSNVVRLYPWDEPR